VTDDLDRFLSLVVRELGAQEARILEADADLAGDEHALATRLPDGRGVVARFAAPPPDRETRQRRLEMLASTFDTVVEEVGPGRRSRPPVAESLHDALVALCKRGLAANAMVIDANSPIVWGAAYPDGVIAQPPLASSPRLAESPANDEGDSVGVAAVSRRALQAVRARPDLAALRKGKHVRHVEPAGDAPLVAHSFAGIYLLVVVFDGPFDELRAERAVLEALGRVERLVLALPPLDPSPFEGGGVMAMRRPRRR
jgi:hypothetical protein